jgi:hypothetical protein
MAINTPQPTHTDYELCGWHITIVNRYPESGDYNPAIVPTYTVTVCKKGSDEPDISRCRDDLPTHAHALWAGLRDIAMLTQGRDDALSRSLQRMCENWEQSLMAQMVTYRISD